MSFKKYALSRLFIGLLAVGVLFLFSDLAGLPAWIVSVIWTPFGWFLHYWYLQNQKRSNDGFMDWGGKK